MSDDTTPLRDAVEADFRSAHGAAAVLTGYYIVAQGVGFDDDGNRITHVVERWTGNAIEQLGLVGYAHHRILDRLPSRERDR